jgi:hypothetical protein
MIGSCLGQRVFIPGTAPYSATKGAFKIPQSQMSHDISLYSLDTYDAATSLLDV